MTAEDPATHSDRSIPPFLITCLAGTLLVRLFFHAFFLPAYEGPDEAFHLGRIVAFADRPLAIAFAGEPLDGSVRRAARIHPHAGAERFVGTHSTFNLLHPLPSEPGGTTERNPENNQPPLFYLGVGLVLRLCARFRLAGGILGPDSRLLVTRLICAVLVAAAVCGPMRELLQRRGRSLTVLGLLAMLVPGASEALVRCSNDAAVFGWTAVVLWLTARRAPGWLLVATLAAGPLIKLTALPVCLVTIVALWIAGRRRTALWGLAATGLVFPIQWARGWLWATYELNRPIPALHEPGWLITKGLCRSLYTFVKTIFWLGGGSFFRPPVPLVAAYFALIAAFLVFSRSRLRVRRLLPHGPHVAGAALASLGLVVFILANRRFFGGWGGVGGWYAWGWAPWIILAFDDSRELTARGRSGLIAASAVFVALANVVYFRMALRIYG